jgi:hypothetical protein
MGGVRGMQVPMPGSCHCIRRNNQNQEEENTSSFKDEAEGFEKSLLLRVIRPEQNKSGNSPWRLL